MLYYANKKEIVHNNNNEEKYVLIKLCFLLLYILTYTLSKKDVWSATIRFRFHYYIKSNLILLFQFFLDNFKIEPIFPSWNNFWRFKDELVGDWQPPETAVVHYKWTINHNFRKQNSFIFVLSCQICFTYVVSEIKYLLWYTSFWETQPYWQSFINILQESILPSNLCKQWSAISIVTYVSSDQQFP